MAEEEEEMSEWSELIPTHLLEVIFDRLMSDGDYIDRLISYNCDYIRFGTVCSSWRSVFIDNVDNVESKRPHPQPPLLMIPLIHDNVVDGSSDISATTDTTTANKRSLYSVTEQMVYKTPVTVPDNVYCFGSSHGWLTTVAMDDDSYPVRLLNPFLPINCNEIQLPSLHAMPVHENAPLWHYTYARKFVVSYDLAAATGTTFNDNYTVMTTCGACHELLLWKSGHETWTTVTIEKKRKCGIHDFIHYKDRYYAITSKGEVLVTVDNNSRAVIYAPPPANTFQYVSRKYVIEASGDLFQVQRHVYGDPEQYCTFDFEVFKLLDYDGTESGEDEKMQERSWERVDTLDGHAFFIGSNASMSILASEFPGCKPNCIYFSDDSIERIWKNSLNPKDIGVYSLEEESFDHHFYGKEISLWPNPIWIEPTICRASRSDSNI